MRSLIDRKAAYGSAFLAALLLIPSAPAAAQGHYGDAVSAAQDCAASIKDFQIDVKILKQRGWKQAKMDGELRGVVTAWVRPDGLPMLVMFGTCIVKFSMDATEIDPLTSAFTERLSVQPVVGSDNHRTWTVPQATIELIPDATGGTNVSVVIKAPLLARSQ